MAAIRVRRFVCEEDSCLRKTFAERVSGFTRRLGRRTERLRSTLVSIGLSLAGRADARMADAFGSPVSRALLRLIAALPDPPAATPRVVRMDEYAQRKEHVYGTVLVEIETQTPRPVDLPPDREAETPAAWLAERPGIEIICRDRAPSLAECATRAAPQALQVADQWRLWHNPGPTSTVPNPWPRCRTAIGRWTTGRR
ncbi:transposase [Streptomyces phaeochromogenes]|uniref:transposase n=1 Tax=Streptomyces phaeochromogenes TaxID=1923 RepID=UPI003684B14E